MAYILKDSTGVTPIIPCKDDSTEAPTFVISMTGAATILVYQGNYIDEPVLIHTVTEEGVYFGAGITDYYFIEVTSNPALVTISVADKRFNTKRPLKY